MKKFYLSMVCVAAFTLAACGGKDGKAAAPDSDAGQTKETTETVSSETPKGDSPMTLDDFSAQLKKACGIEAITNDKMKNVKVRKEGENTYFLASPVADDIDGEAVQREYFNAFAKVADGNKIYGFHMDESRGTDAFSDYDEYVKFIKANGDYAKAIYGYDYQGKKVKVYCSVSFGDFGLNVKVE